MNDQLQLLTTAANVLWLLLAGFLVFFMQAGFALVETGFTRAKNVAHTMGMNFLVSMTSSFRSSGSVPACRS